MWCAVKSGRMQEHGGATYFFHKFDFIVGYDRGETTNRLRVELSGGEYHGHPMGIERVKKYVSVVDE